MAATPKNSGAPAGFDPASETAEAEATPTTLSVDDIKIEKIEARDLGCKLPVGIFTNDGEHLTEYVLAPYRTKYDRILGQLLQAPKAKITQVLGQFLPQYIQTIGGFTLSELSTKMNGMSPSRIIENMPMGDALSIVVQIRLQAQGEDIAMSAQCPQCGVQNDDDPTKGRPYHDLGSTEVVCFCDLHTKPLIEVVLKDGIERMGDYGQPSLLMHQVDGLFYAQAWLDALLNEKRQHMAFFCADLFTHNKIKTIISFCPEITRP